MPPSYVVRLDAACRPNKCKENPHLRDGIVSCNELLSTAEIMYHFKMCVELYSYSNYEGVPNLSGYRIAIYERVS